MTPPEQAEKIFQQIQDNSKALSLLAEPLAKYTCFDYQGKNDDHFAFIANHSIKRWRLDNLTTLVAFRQTDCFMADVEPTPAHDQEWLSMMQDPDLSSLARKWTAQTLARGYIYGELDEQFMASFPSATATIQTSEDEYEAIRHEELPAKNTITEFLAGNEFIRNVYINILGEEVAEQEAGKRKAFTQQAQADAILLKNHAAFENGSEGTMTLLEFINNKDTTRLLKAIKEQEDQAKMNFIKGKNNLTQN